MLNELYNRIKEQSRFDDIFKPISKEELDKRKKEKLDRILKEGKCTLNPDGTYSCEGDVRFVGLNLRVLPSKFKEVKENFICSYNNLETLEGSPKVVLGSFYCEGNNLKTLEGAPEVVGGYVHIGDNPIAKKLGITRIKGSDLYKYTGGAPTPIPKEKLEKRRKELWKRSEKLLKDLPPLMCQREIDDLVHQIRDMGYRVRVGFLSLNEASLFFRGYWGWRGWEDNGIKIEGVLDSLGIEAFAGVRLKISVTADVNSDIYKNLGLKSFRPFLEERGYLVRGEYSDTKRHETKPNVKWKRITILVAKSSTAEKLPWQTRF